MKVERDAGVVTIVNDDPPINRMTFQYMDDLEALLDEVADDRSVRVLVFTAEGDENFSVGMDLKQLVTDAEARGGPEAVLDQRRRVLHRIEQLGKPSIATLFGYCLGGGLELPLACHFRLAAEEGALIGLPELDLGTIPAWGGTVRLTRCIGRDRALDMILRARKVTGPEALEMGLVSAVHPLAELKRRAHDLALELAAKPPVAVRGALDSVVAAQELSRDDALDVERVGVVRCFGTKDQIEGMRAFIEKRPPVFTGE